MSDERPGDAQAEGPPPPSPLTGAYLLVVLPQLHSSAHKDRLIHALTKGLITWDAQDCHVDLDKELQNITSQSPEGEEAKNGERLIQFASENLVTEVLIHPQLNTLVQCMRNCLSSFTRHRHIIHAGYTSAGNGAWVLQDGTYSFSDFADMYSEHEVQRVLRAYEGTVSVDVHCSGEGDWWALKAKDPFSKVSRVRLNPPDKTTTTAAVRDFLNYLSQYLVPAGLNDLLEPSDVVGNIRFSHPTLYVFPGGQGDAALFGINGFNMLVDGGFSRKACFWDFTRHLDRLDSVLMTRINNGNLQGLVSLFKRKKSEQVYPQIGHFFSNIPDRRQILSPDGDKDRDPLLINLIEQGQEMLSSLRHLGLKPQACYREPSVEPINLYHKVGHGKLDMYVLSPAKDSREVREFLAKWAAVDSKIFCSYSRKGEFSFPLSSKSSICALLVWQPANPEDNITRLLFPGSTPQQKIFEGLDRLKNLEFMKHPICSAKSLSPSSSTIKLSIKATQKPVLIEKVGEIEKKQSETVKAVKQMGDTKKPTPPPPKPKPKADRPKEKPKTDLDTKPETAKIDKKTTEAVQKVEKEVKKEKPKRTIHKPPEKKMQKPPEKKTDSVKSSPTTPKKNVENKLTEMSVTKTETKTRASRAKASPTATPAKSAKEENNRKVFELKSRESTRHQKLPPAKKEEPKKIEKTLGKKPSASPKGVKSLSPIKAAKPPTKQRLDVKKTSKTEKDIITDSSAVSTPSTVDAELTKAKEDTEKTKEISDSKPEDTNISRKASEDIGKSISKEEDEEILIIEKVEISDEVTGKADVKKIALHLQKADEEKKKKPKEEKVVAIEEKEISDALSKEKTAELSNGAGRSPDTKQLAQEEVEEIIETATEIVTKKLDTQKTDSQEVSGKDLGSTEKPVTPKEKDTKSGEVEQRIDESQPDERFSTTVESGATTTAPTLPEDERIPLDEIKEGIEEKYIKEETKEKEIIATPRPEQPTSLPHVPAISGTVYDQRAQLLKDIVKTPDEVADLPVHEEVDGGIYDVVGKDELLNLPATKKEKKDETTEELKLFKDNLEKEDKSKDLKEDMVESADVLSHTTTDLDMVSSSPKSGKPLESDEKEEIQEDEKIDIENEEEIPAKISDLKEIDHVEISKKEKVGEPAAVEEQSSKAEDLKEITEKETIESKEKEEIKAQALMLLTLKEKVIQPAREEIEIEKDEGVYFEESTPQLESKDAMFLENENVEEAAKYSKLDIKLGEDTKEIVLESEKIKELENLKDKELSLIRSEIKETAIEDLEILETKTEVIDEKAQLEKDEKHQMEEEVLDKIAEVTAKGTEVIDENVKTVEQEASKEVIKKDLAQEDIVDEKISQKKETKDIEPAKPDATEMKQIEKKIKETLDSQDLIQPKLEEKDEVGKENQVKSDTEKESITEIQELERKKSLSQDKETKEILQEEKDKTEQKVLKEEDKVKQILSTNEISHPELKKTEDEHEEELKKADTDITKGQIAGQELKTDETELKEEATLKKPTTPEEKTLAAELAESERILEMEDLKITNEKLTKSYLLEEEKKLSDKEEVDSIAVKEKQITEEIKDKVVYMNGQLADDSKKKADEFILKDEIIKEKEIITVEQKEIIISADKEVKGEKEDILEEIESLSEIKSKTVDEKSMELKEIEDKLPEDGISTTEKGTVDLENKIKEGIKSETEESIKTELQETVENISVQKVVAEEMAKEVKEDEKIVAKVEKIETKTEQTETKTTKEELETDQLEETVVNGLIKEEMIFKDTVEDIIDIKKDDLKPSEYEIQHLSDETAYIKKRDEELISATQQLSFMGSELDEMTGIKKTEIQKDVSSEKTQADIKTVDLVKELELKDLDAESAKEDKVKTDTKLDVEIKTDDLSVQKEITSEKEIETEVSKKEAELDYFKVTPDIQKKDDTKQEVTDIKVETAVGDKETKEKVTEDKKEKEPKRDDKKDIVAKEETEEKIVEDIKELDIKSTEEKLDDVEALIEPKQKLINEIVTTKEKNDEVKEESESKLVEEKQDKETKFVKESEKIEVKSVEEIKEPEVKQSEEKIEPELKMLEETKKSEVEEKKESEIKLGYEMKESETKPSKEYLILGIKSVEEEKESFIQSTEEMKDTKIKQDEEKLELKLKSIDGKEEAKVKPDLEIKTPTDVNDLEVKLLDKKKEAEVKLAKGKVEPDTKLSDDIIESDTKLMEDDKFFDFATGKQTDIEINNILAKETHEITPKITDNEEDVSVKPLEDKKEGLKSDGKVESSEEEKVLDEVMIEDGRKFYDELLVEKREDEKEKEDIKSSDEEKGAVEGKESHEVKPADEKKETEEAKEILDKQAKVEIPIDEKKDHVLADVEEEKVVEDKLVEEKISEIKSTEEEDIKTVVKDLQSTDLDIVETKVKLEDEMLKFGVQHVDKANEEIIPKTATKELEMDLKHETTATIKTKESENKTLEESDAKFLDRKKETDVNSVEEMKIKQEDFGTKIESVTGDELLKEIQEPESSLKEEKKEPQDVPSAGLDRPVAEQKELENKQTEKPVEEKLVQQRKELEVETLLMKKEFELKLTDEMEIGIKSVEEKIEPETKSAEEKKVLETKPTDEKEVLEMKSVEEKIESEYQPTEEHLILKSAEEKKESEGKTVGEKKEPEVKPADEKKLVAGKKEPELKPADEKEVSEMKLVDEKKEPEVKPADEKEVSEMKFVDEKEEPEVKPADEKEVSEMKLVDEKKESEVKPADEKKLVDGMKEPELKPADEKEVSEMKLVDKKEEPEVKPADEKEVSEMKLVDEKKESEVKPADEKKLVDGKKEPELKHADEKEVSEMKLVDEKKEPEVKLADEKEVSEMKLVDEKKEPEVKPADEKEVSEMKLVDEKKEPELKLADEKEVSEMKLVDEKKEPEVKPADEKNLVDGKKEPELKPADEKKESEVKLADEQKTSEQTFSVKKEVELKPTEEQKESELKLADEKKELEQKEFELKLSEEINDIKFEPAEEQKESELKVAEEKKESELKAAEEIKESEQKAAEEKKESELKAAEEIKESEQKAAEEKKESEQKAAEVKKESELKAAEVKKESELKAAEVKKESELKAAEVKKECELKAAEDKKECELKAAEVKKESELKAAEVKKESELKAAEVKKESELKAAEVKKESELKAAEVKKECELKAAEEKKESELKAAEEKKESEQKTAEEKKESELKTAEGKKEIGLKPVEEQKGPELTPADKKEVELKPAEEQKESELKLAGEKKEIELKLPAEIKESEITLVEEKKEIELKPAEEQKESELKVADEKKGKESKSASEKIESETVLEEDKKESYVKPVVEPAEDINVPETKPFYEKKEVEIKLSEGKIGSKDESTDEKEIELKLAEKEIKTELKQSEEFTTERTKALDEKKEVDVTQLTEIMSDEEKKVADAKATEDKETDSAKKSMEPLAEAKKMLETEFESEVKPELIDTKLTDEKKELLPKLDMSKESILKPEDDLKDFVTSVETVDSSFISKTTEMKDSSHKQFEEKTEVVDSLAAVTEKLESKESIETETKFLEQISVGREHFESQFLTELKEAEGTVKTMKESHEDAKSFELKDIEMISKIAEDKHLDIVKLTTETKEELKTKETVTESTIKEEKLKSVEMEKIKTTTIENGIDKQEIIYDSDQLLESGIIDDKEKTGSTASGVGVDVSGSSSSTEMVKELPKVEKGALDCSIKEEKTEKIKVEIPFSIKSDEVKESVLVEKEHFVTSDQKEFITESESSLKEHFSIHELKSTEPCCGTKVNGFSQVTTEFEEHASTSKIEKSSEINITEHTEVSEITSVQKETVLEQVTDLPSSVKGEKDTANADLRSKIIDEKQEDTTEDEDKEIDKAFTKKDDTKKDTGLDVCVKELSGEKGTVEKCLPKYTNGDQVTSDKYHSESSKTFHSSEELTPTPLEQQTTVSEKTVFSNGKLGQLTGDIKSTSEVETKISKDSGPKGFTTVTTVTTTTTTRTFVPDKPNATDSPDNGIQKTEETITKTETKYSAEADKPMSVTQKQSSDMSLGEEISEKVEKIVTEKHEIESVKDAAEIKAKFISEIPPTLNGSANLEDGKTGTSKIEKILNGSCSESKNIYEGKSEIGEKSLAAEIEDGIKLLSSTLETKVLEKIKTEESKISLELEKCLETAHREKTTESVKETSEASSSHKSSESKQDTLKDISMIKDMTASFISTERWTDRRTETPEGRATPSSEATWRESDDDLPPSPMSTTSHLHSPPPAMFSSMYPQDDDSDISFGKPDIDFETAAREHAETRGETLPKDPIEKWGKPLGLPPPPSGKDYWSPFKEWGRPLHLPSPAPAPPENDTEDTSGSAKTTPKKVAKMNEENNRFASNIVIGKEANNRNKRSDSPVKRNIKDGKKSGMGHIYLDLSYVPHHGNSHYANVEFFKRVRARYYVFSGTEPSKDVFNALLEAKQQWEDKDLEVTIIPTYDTDTLGYWIAENEETLSKYKIDLSPSASRCTINLQDHDTSCSAYRLEF